MNLFCPACNHDTDDHPGGTITRRLGEADLCTGCRICGPKVINLRGTIHLRHGEKLEGPGVWSTIIRKPAERSPLDAVRTMKDIVAEMLSPFEKLADALTPPAPAGERLRGILNTGPADIPLFPKISSMIPPDRPLLNWADSIVSTAASAAVAGSAFRSAIDGARKAEEDSVIAAQMALYAGVDDGWRPAQSRPEPKTTLWGLPVTVVPDGAGLIVQGTLPPALARRLDRYGPPQVSVGFDLKPGEAMVTGNGRDFVRITNTNQKRKTNMATRKALESAIGSLAERLEKLKRFPESDNEFPMATIIGFDVRYPGNPKAYNFAAIKTPKGWALTGRESRFFTWDELTAWLAEEVECLALVVVSEVEELIEPTIDDEETAYGEDVEK